MRQGAMQATFADLEYGAKKRKTRREKFLERMDALMPWPTGVAGAVVAGGHGGGREHRGGAVVDEEP